MKKVMMLMGCLLPCMIWSQEVDTSKTRVIGVPEMRRAPLLIDSLLPIVPVVGFLDSRMSRDVPAPIHVVGKELIGATDQTSLMTAMNSVPGVMMESRGAGGSHRISIRGSALRAPFAVRNVKMYVNGIAFTSPDGQSPLEVMDAADLRSIEVMRGPSGSMWGSGNGGVLQFNLTDPFYRYNGGFVARSEAQVGSFEQYRMNHSVLTGGKKWALRFSQTNQSVAGYRQQEFNRKNSSLLHARIATGDNQILEIIGLYYNGNWGLPGGLTSQQRDEDRTLAIPYSVDNNASVWRDRKMLGLGHTVYKNNWKWRNTVNIYDTQKTNPYGTSAFRNGFKVESAAGGGWRSEYSRYFNIRGVQQRFVAGGEAQMEHYFIDETSNNGGRAGDFKYMYNVNYTNANAFGLVELNVLRRIHIQAGGSVLQESQLVSGYTLSGWQTDTVHRSDLMVLPRVAVSIDLAENWKVFGSYGLGNSMPTVFEMVDYANNQYNLNLQPELGINREAGIKYANPAFERSFEVNAYYTNIRGIILNTPTMVAAPGNPGSMIEIDVFANTGTTAQQGLEWAGIWTKYFDSRRLKVQWQSTGSWNVHRFIDYTVDDQNYATRRLPGVPTVQWFNHLSLFYRRNYGLGAMVQYMGPMDLNYSNSVRSTDYTVVNVYATALKKWGKHISIGVRAGVNNLTDERYSGFFNYNDFNGRYYNPALPFNYFALLSLEYNMIKAQ